MEHTDTHSCRHAHTRAHQVCPVGNRKQGNRGCSKLNLCAGLGPGIDGAVHSTLAYYIKVQFPPAEYQALLAGRAYREKGMRGSGKG